MNVDLNKIIFFIIIWPLAIVSNLKAETLKHSNPIIVLIGPEGDFSPSERDSILGNSNVTSFTLSRNILRSDTAVISAISLVNFIKNSY